MGYEGRQLQQHQSHIYSLVRPTHDIFLLNNSKCSQTSGQRVAESYSTMFRKHTIHQTSYNLNSIKESLSNSFRGFTVSTCYRERLTCLPKEKGIYRYLIMCRIWRFIVKINKTIQYSRRIGQKTGTSKMLKNVSTNATQSAFVNAYLQSNRETPKSSTSM